MEGRITYRQNRARRGAAPDDAVCEFSERLGRRFGAGRVPSAMVGPKFSKRFSTGSLAMRGDELRGPKTMMPGVVRRSAA